MSSTVAAAAVPGRTYGAAELKSSYQKYWMVGFSIAVGIHFMIVGGYYAAQYLREEEPPVMNVRIMKYSDLGPPPSITNANTPPPIAVTAPTVKPTIGAPVPVPDAEVSPEQTIATQTEMSSQVAPVGDGTGET